MEINKNWDRITLRKYLSYVEFYNSNKNKDNLSLRLLSFLDDIDYQKLVEYPIGALELKLDRWKFLQEDFTEVVVNNPILDIGGEVLIINKNFSLLSFGQWQNMDELLKLSDDDGNHLKNIHMLIAISSMQPASYNYERAKELGELILDQNMFDIIPNIVFFFNKDYQSSTNILTCLREVQDQKILEMEVTMNKLRTSTRSGAGTGLWCRWRTRILLSLMQYWLKLYKMYSLI